MSPAVLALPLDRPRRLAMLAPHPVLRLGVEVVLAQHGAVQVCGSFANEGDLLDLLHLQPGSIDLLLIDVLAPCGPEGGLSLLRLLSHRWPRLPVLVLSAHCNASTVTAAMQAGARGFLPKGTSPAMLMRAIDVLARGGRFVPPELRTQLNRSRMRRTPAPMLAPLSRGEREVLRLVPARLHHRRGRAAFRTHGQHRQHAEAYRLPEARDPKRRRTVPHPAPARMRMNGLIRPGTASLPPALNRPRG